jgi:hypothetical protein
VALHHVAQLQTQHLAHQQRAFAETPPALAPAGPTRPVDGKYGGSRKPDAHDSRPGTGYACPWRILRRNVSKLPLSMAQQQTDGNRAGSWQRAKFWAKKPSKVEKVPASRTSERLRSACWKHSIQNQDYPPTRPTTIPAIPYLPHHGTIPLRRKITMSLLGRATGAWEDNRAGDWSWVVEKETLSGDTVDGYRRRAIIIGLCQRSLYKLCLRGCCCTCLALLDSLLWGQNRDQSFCAPDYL